MLVFFRGFSHIISSSCHCFAFETPSKDAVVFDIYFSSTPNLPVVKEIAVIFV